MNKCIIINYIFYCKLWHSFWVVSQLSQGTWFLVLMLYGSNSCGSTITTLFTLLLQTILHTKNTCTCNSCNIGTRDLPDMYARGLQALGLRAYISGKSWVHMKDCKDFSSVRESAIRYNYDINVIKVEVNTKISMKLRLNTKYNPS